MTREKLAVLFGFGLLTVLLLVVIEEFTTLPRWAAVTVLLTTGLVLPYVINRRLVE